MSGISDGDIVSVKGRKQEGVVAKISEKGSVVVYFINPDANVCCGLSDLDLVRKGPVTATVII